MSNTLVSVIKAARPRRALFTTFTLSLSWFEALVLPALRQCHCERIDVLADARQACKATDEATSLYAGSAYRVIPVYMGKTTVFHPKLAYLEGRDDLDHLVVSSANLTMSGHGRNLEVIDAVSSVTEPAVFGEFAEFLLGLAAKFSFSTESLDVLNEYQRRAATQAVRTEASATMPRRTWLIHTLEKPASEQFIEHAARIDDPYRLTVLSPFHAPGAAPVRDLAQALGVNTLRIGLDARSLVAPFTHEGVFDSPPDYVVAKRDDEDSRLLHAKCFELEGSNGTLVMTGSVNATGQSLNSTDNVEVSLVRLLPTSPFTWEAATPVAFAPCEFKVDAMTARNPALQVTWTLANQLTGRIEPSGDTALVKLSVWDRDGCLALFNDVRLDNGAFSVNMGQSVNARGALRLIVEAPDLHAEGWINVELDLTSDELQRDLARATGRVLSSEFRLEDLDTIFGWLSRLQTRVRSQASRDPEAASQSSPANPNEKVPGTGRKLSYEEWRESIEMPKVGGTPSGLVRNSVEAVLRWLNRDLSPQPTTTLPTRNSSPPSEDTPKSDSSPSPKRTLLTTDKAEFSSGGLADQASQRTYALYQSLLESVPKGLALDARSSMAPILVELSGCAQLKPVLAGEDRGRQVGEHATPMLESWLTRFAAFDYGEDNRQILLPFFSAMACIAASTDTQISLPSLKQALELLAGRPLQQDEIATGARLALRANRFDRLTQDQKHMALAATSALEAALTQSQRLVALIERVMTANTKSDLDIPPRYKKAFEALWQHRKGMRGVFGVVGRSMVSTASSTPTASTTPAPPMACPCCYSRLHSDDASRLRTDQVFLCLNCQHPIFYALDTSALDRSGLNGRYKKH